MNIVKKKFWTKLQQNILQNASNCTILKNFLGGACPRSPIANAWLCHVQQIPPLSKINLTPPPPC